MNRTGNILAGVVFVVSLISSLIIFNLGKQVWWLPIFGAGLAITGLYFEKGRIVDIGSLLLVASFFFLIRAISLNYLTLIFILSIFFIFVSLWLFMRRFLFIINLEKGISKPREFSHLAEYKKDSTLYYLRTQVLGYAISLLGGFIAISSFIGPFPAGLGVFIKITLSISVIIGIYSVLFLLPRYVMK